MGIYTRNGDAGQTSIFDESGISKNDARIMALGALDELNSYVGLIKAMLARLPEKDFLDDIQGKIMVVSSHIHDRGNKAYLLTPEDTRALEIAIDAMEVPRQRVLIKPGANVISAHIDVARTVARRAETHVVGLGFVDSAALMFVNRLSDYLYTLARKYDNVANV